MEQYDRLSYRFSRELTNEYSSSFGLASRLFVPEVRRHIYAVYGLVRIADEIADTYQGLRQDRLLDGLEAEIFQAIRLGYSANPIVHAYAQTARTYDIDPLTIKSFFRSMRLDLAPITYTPRLYAEYIFGSAEVVGLMCLSIFVDGDKKLYKELTPGARALGAAYQKVNFLRDIGADFRERQRMYFPGHSYQDFDEAAKQAVIDDIAKDFATAKQAIDKLPDGSRRAVLVSYRIYTRLLNKLRDTPIETIKQQRVRISSAQKLLTAGQTIVQGKA